MHHEQGRLGFNDGITWNEFYYHTISGPLAMGMFIQMALRRAISIHFPNSNH